MWKIRQVKNTEVNTQLEKNSPSVYHYIYFNKTLSETVHLGFSRHLVRPAHEIPGIACPDLKSALLSCLEEPPTTLYPSCLSALQCFNVVPSSVPLFPWIPTLCAQHLSAFAFLKGSVNSGLQPRFSTSKDRRHNDLIMYRSVFSNLHFLFLRTNECGCDRHPSEL